MKFSITQYRSLSVVQRDRLIKHVEGAQPFLAIDPRTIHKLLDYRLIVGDRLNHPRTTTLTELGREVCARLLAEYADALVAAGCLDLDSFGNSAVRPLDVLNQLKSRHEEWRRRNKPRQPVTPADLASQMAETGEKPGV